MRDFDWNDLPEVNGYWSLDELSSDNLNVMITAGLDMELLKELQFHQSEFTVLAWVAIKKQINFL